MSYQIEFRHLKYFQAVAEELNFRKASEKLFISQPGLSRQIKQMEDLLDAQLFERTKRNVKLTQAGSYLKSEADFIFNRMDMILRQTQLMSKGESGELRIGFVGSAIHGVLPSFMLKLNEKFPNIHTSLSELANHEQIEAISTDKLDIGFVRVSHVPETLNISLVHEESFSLVLPETHHLNIEDFKHIGQVKAEKFILFSSDYSPEYYDKIVSICRDQGFEPEVSHKSVHAFTIFKLVENHLGIAIVPTSLLDGYNLKIKSIALDKIPQKTTLSVIWKKGNLNNTVGNAIQLLTSDAQ